MKKETIDTIIGSLKTTQGSDNDKLFTASLLLIGVLQEKSAYRRKTGRPLAGFRKAVSDIQHLVPFQWMLNGLNNFRISPEIIVSRFIAENDLRYLEIHPFFDYDLPDSSEDSYLDKDQMELVIQAEKEFEIFFTPFLICAERPQNEEQRLVAILLGLMWCASQDEVNGEVSRFLAYLIHDFEPISSRFGEDEIILAIAPDGHIRRSKDRTSSELFMKSGFWESRINGC